MSKIRLKSVGADPELFLHDPEEDLNIPAIGIIGGTKAEPRFISDEGHALQEDNVMAEFNIPPSKTEAEFISNIQYALDYLASDLPEPLNPLIIPTCQFIPEFLEEEQAQIAGCDPFINAWTGEIEEIHLGEKTTRDAGGHIHISYTNPDNEISQKLTRYCDLVLGLSSILLDPYKERRKTYGQAGAFRYKEYGLEYRTLSNFWIKNEALMGWAFNGVETAVDLYNEGVPVPDDVRTCINNSDQTKAKKILDEWKIDYPK